jgi:hypothetical protein
MNDNNFMIVAVNRRELGDHSMEKFLVRQQAATELYRDTQSDSPILALHRSAGFKSTCIVIPGRLPKNSANPGLGL